MNSFLDELTQISSSLTLFQFRLTEFLTQEKEEVDSASIPDLRSLLDELQAPISTVISLALRAETLLRSKSFEESTFLVKEELILPSDNDDGTSEEKVFHEEGQLSPEEFLLPETDPEVDEDTLILPHEGSPSVSQSIQPIRHKEKKPKVKRKRNQDVGDKDKDDPETDPFQDIWPRIPKDSQGKFRCPFRACDKLLRCKADVRTHMGRRHKDDLVTKYGIRLEDFWHHKCATCGSLHSNKSALAQHERTHATDPFPCIVCGSSFTRADSLRRHLNLHTGERKYSCEPCGKSFPQKHHLVSHQIAVHPEQIGHQFVSCDICGKKFKRKINMKIHKRRVHPDIKPDLRPRRK